MSMLSGPPRRFLNLILEAKLWAHLWVLEWSNRCFKIVDFRFITRLPGRNSKIAKEISKFDPGVCDVRGMLQILKAFRLVFYSLPSMYYWYPRLRSLRRNSIFHSVCFQRRYFSRFSDGETAHISLLQTCRRSSRRPATSPSSDLYCRWVLRSLSTFSTRYYVFHETTADYWHSLSRRESHPSLGRPISCRANDVISNKFMTLLFSVWDVVGLTNWIRLEAWSRPKLTKGLDPIRGHDPNYRLPLIDSACLNI